MADNLMKKLPFTRFAMEMRSGKIIERGRYEKWTCVQGYCSGC